MTLRIDRPARQNRLNLPVLEDLRGALEDAGAARDVRAVVLTGTGSTFSCGGDIEELPRGDREAFRELGRRFAALHLALLRSSKPVLAAVNGDALAGGLSLLAACDLAVARASARFAMPEIKAGLWPVMAQVALNRALPRKRVFELYYLGESFGAERAMDWGLVNWVVPDGDFDAAVLARAGQLAGLPPAAVRVGRAAFAELADLSYEDAYARSAERLVELLADPAMAEALAARAGKGPP